MSFSPLLLTPGKETPLSACKVFLAFCWEAKKKRTKPQNMYIESGFLRVKLQAAVARKRSLCLSGQRLVLPSSRRGRRLDAPRPLYRLRGVVVQQQQNPMHVARQEIRHAHRGQGRFKAGRERRGAGPREEVGVANRFRQSRVWLHVASFEFSSHSFFFLPNGAIQIWTWLGLSARQDQRKTTHTHYPLLCRRECKMQSFAGA